MLLFFTPFTPGQVTLITVIVVVFALLVAGNGLLAYLLFYRKKKRKLCTASLQQRREELLEELNNLRFTAISQGVEEDEIDETLDDADDEADEDAEQDDLDADETEEEAEEDVSVFNAEILAVKDMSDELRQKFGFVGEEYERKRYYVRASYSFEAKLRFADYEVKRRYAEICDEIARYKSVSQKRSFRQERVYSGRKTWALLLMRGKTLCIALALNPKDYQNTKYRGIDKSDKKRFANTPMLIKLTSDRRLSYAKYLLSAVAQNNAASAQQAESRRYDLAKLPFDELLAQKQAKLTVLGEAEELDDFDDDFADVAATEGTSVRAGILRISDMTDEMLKRLNLIGHEFDNKSYYVRYNYGFEAKLRTASDTVKQRYVSLADEIGLYKKMTLNGSFRQQRIYCGRKTLGVLLFKGKTLCIALALNPKDYQNTKYRGEDVSDKKRFAKTPMLIRLTSERKVGYAKYLLNRLAEEKLIVMNPSPRKGNYDLQAMDMGELFANNLLKITVIGEVPQK